tara:strand:+ start:92 stop:727 length:636 start_codon:yes stop_codon:yes gene_type:complete
MAIKKSISNQSELQSYFKDNTLYLNKKSKLTFYSDLVIGQNITFKGNVEIGKKNIIENNCSFSETFIGNNNNFQQNSIIKNSKISNFNNIGPFTFIRSDTIIRNHNRIGSFIEIVRSKIMNYVQISHQAFLADIFLDNEVIIGAGVAIANYNKNKRHNSLVGKKSLIGCNTVLVAPLKIGSKVIIGSGSCINFDVKNNKTIVQKRITTEII